MKLSSLFIEELKVPFSDKEQILKGKFIQEKVSAGGQGNTKRHTKLNDSDEVEATYYEKKLDDALYYIREINAYSILQMVNKAGRAYGFRTDVVPLPHLVKWKYSDDKVIFTSAANAEAQDLSLKRAEKLFDTLVEKTLFGKVLIGDGDLTHTPNFYKAKGKKTFYVFDFGYAFNAEHGDRIYKLLERKIKEIKKQDNESIKKAKMNKLADYLNFWEMFLEHNKSYMSDKIWANADQLKQNTAFDDSQIDKISETIDTSLKFNIKQMDFYIKKYIKELNRL